ncbi:hypothetical protein P308_15425 [Pseudomonas piscis]|nr:hypothetical protein P308_15425 [Pseudomonas piscis]
MCLVVVVAQVPASGQGGSVGLGQQFSVLGRGNSGVGRYTDRYTFAVLSSGLLLGLVLLALALCARQMLVGVAAFLAIGMSLALIVRVMRTANPNPNPRPLVNSVQVSMIDAGLDRPGRLWAEGALVDWRPVGAAGSVGDQGQGIAGAM